MPTDKPIIDLPVMPNPTGGDPARPWRVKTLLSNNYPSLAAFDQAIEAEAADQDADGYDLEEMRFSANSLAIPQAAKGPGGRLVNSGGQPAAMEIAIIQTLAVQLYFVESED